MRYPPIADRVKAATDVQPTGCWNWLGAKDKRGYGFIYYGGRNQRAHRIVYLLGHGDIPVGMYICHRCDNPSCVKPEHLFLGSPAANYWDARRKGRMPRLERVPYDTSGENNGQAKLGADDVRRVRILRQNGAQLLAIAERFGISRTQVHNIITRKKWASIE